MVNSSLQMINSTIYTLVKLFAKSSYKHEILTENEIEQLGEELQLIKPTDIRWLSKLKAIGRIKELYFPIISTLQELLQNENDLILDSLLKQMKSPAFLFYITFFTEILGPCDKLNRSLQNKKMNIWDIEKYIKITINEINEKFINKSFVVFDEKLIQKIAKIESLYKQFSEEGWQNAQYIISKNLASECIENIKQRFPNSLDIHDF